MPTEKKERILRELRELLSKCTIAVLTGYRGLSVAEMSQLRRKLREMGIDYHVVKNTLVRLAAKGTDKEKLASIIEGPTALAFGYGDISVPTKVLQEHIRSSRINLSINGAVIAQRAFSPEEVTTLASLPPKEALIGQLLGSLQGPMIALVNVLSGNMRSLLNVLQARVRQMEGE